MALSYVVGFLRTPRNTTTGDKNIRKERRFERIHKRPVRVYFFSGFMKGLQEL
jgi:hypothetical protein